MSHPIIPVILCGGSGTRLWPASREKYPKQFLSLLSERSLLQDTARRSLRTTATTADKIITVTLGDLSQHVAGQLAALDVAAARHILCEPSARNTAAAIALAACHVEAVYGPNAIMLVLPSDHHIGNESELAKAYALGAEAAAKDYLVTFGITPTRPETGYGYIKLGNTLEGFTATHSAAAFVEKPNLPTAQSYVADGSYLWNSGMFMYRTGKVLAEYETHSPAILAAVRKAMRAGDNYKPDAATYAAIPSEPFDKAIMERSHAVAVIPVQPDWSDIGSWESLWEISQRNEQQNVVQGNAALANSTGCLVMAHSSRLIACAGLKNTVVVDTGDAVLVADRSDQDALRALVAQLKKANDPRVSELPESLIMEQLRTTE